MGKTGADLPVIIGQAGPLNGERWLINDAVTIGRDETCGVVVPDRQVSRFHARLLVKDEGVMLEDLGSKNGTFYEGKRVDGPIYIQDGGLIQIALVQNFVFLSSDSTMPLGQGLLPVEPMGGRLFLDVRSRRVWIDSDEIVPPLSVPQFRLLHTLYEHRGQVVSRDELVNVDLGRGRVGRRFRRGAGCASAPAARPPGRYRCRSCLYRHRARSRAATG